MVFQTKLYSVSVVFETLPVQVVSRFHESFQQLQQELHQWPLLQLFKGILLVPEIESCHLLVQGSVSTIDSHFREDFGCVELCERVEVGFSFIKDLFEKRTFEVFSDFFTLAKERKQR